MSTSRQRLSSAKPMIPSAAQRSLIPQASGPSGPSNPNASAHALREMQDKRVRAMADPQSVLSRQNIASSSERHREMISQLDVRYDHQIFNAGDMSTSKLKRQHPPDPESPGKKRGELEPQERGAGILFNENSPRHVSGTPEEDRSRHSTPVIAYSRSPSRHPQSAHTLGPPINLQYSQNSSEGSSSHPIQISPVNSPLGVRPSHIKEWDDHDVQAVPKEESKYIPSRPPSGAGKEDQADVSQSQQRQAKANPTKPRTRGKAKARVYVDYDPDVQELPPVKAATQTGKTLVSEYFSGDCFEPPNVFASAADASNYCQATLAGSAVASSHIALLDLQVQLHILQTMMTTQEIKRQTLNLQLTDRGRAPMTFHGFLPDPIDRLDDVYNLISARQKMRGTALDPAQTVTLYGVVRHVLKNREEHGIPAITVNGGLPLHPVATWEEAEHESGRVWEDAQGMTGTVDGIEDHTFLPKSVSVSPSRIPRRAGLPTPASTTRQHSVYPTSTASRASVPEASVSSRSHHDPRPPVEYYSAPPPSAASSSRASGTSSHQHSRPSADYYSTRPPSTTSRAPIPEASTRIHQNPRPPTTHHSARPPPTASSTRESESGHHYQKRPPATHHSTRPPSAASSTRASGTSSHHNNRPPSAAPSSKTSVKPGSRSNGNVYKVPKSTK